LNEGRPGAQFGDEDVCVKIDASLEHLCRDYDLSLPRLPEECRFDLATVARAEARVEQEWRLQASFLQRRS
jgi:hypothetical protein